MSFEYFFQRVDRASQNFSADLYNCPIEGDPAIKCGAGSNDAVASDHGALDHFTSGKRHNERNNCVARKVNPVHFLANVIEKVMLTECDRL